MSDSSYITSDDVPSDGTTAPPQPRRDVPGLPDPSVGVLRGDDGTGTDDGHASDDDSGSILARAAALRFPELKDLQTGVKISALIDYINDSTIARGDLEQLRLEAHVKLRDARRQLAECNVPVSRSTSKAALDELRRRSAPAVAAMVDDAKWVIDRCTEQIARLGGTDYEAASRVYTLLSGS